MLKIPVKNPLVVQLVTVGAGIVAVIVAHFAPDYLILLSQILNVVGIGAMGVGAASITAKQPSEPSPDDTVRIVPSAASATSPDRSRLHNDRPDEPAEFRVWDWWPALLVVLLLAVATQPSCSAFRSVTPADRAEAYTAQAKAVELACKAYRFDVATGRVADVPSMAKLCVGS